MSVKFFVLFMGLLGSSYLLAGCILGDAIHNNYYSNATDNSSDNRTQATLNAEDNQSGDPLDNPSNSAYASPTGLTGLPTAFPPSTSGENNPTLQPQATRGTDPTDYGDPTTPGATQYGDPTSTPTPTPASPTITFTPGPAGYQPFSSSAYNEALANHERVYLHFYSPNTGQCDSQEQVAVQAFQGMSHDAYFNGLKGFHVDFATETQLKQTYQVNNPCTHVFIGTDGMVKAKTNDAYNEQQFVQTMHTTLTP